MLTEQEKKILTVLNDLFKNTSIKYDDLNIKHSLSNERQDFLCNLMMRHPELTLEKDNYSSNLSITSFGLINTITRLIFKKPLYLKIDLNGNIKGVEFLDEEDVTDNL